MVMVVIGDTAKMVVVMRMVVAIVMKMTMMSILTRKP